jgi:hypothetical protein
MAQDPHVVQLSLRPRFHGALPADNRAGAMRYSPEFVEWVFSEVRLTRVLRSSLRIHRAFITFATLPATQLPGVKGDRLSRNALTIALIIGVTLLVMLVLAALVLASISGLQWYLNPDNELSIGERRQLVQGLASAGQALAVFLTGAVGLIGLFFTWRNTSQARQSTQQTLKLTEQGQVTQRFTQAIDQLGKTDDKGKKVLEVRVGAIHALGQIATQSEEDYYWPIIEILCAYVRHNAPRDPTKKVEISETMLQGHADLDIQTILDTIGRHTERPSIQTRLTLIDLANTDLRNSNFTKANFSACWFNAADLRGANFLRADLRSTSFRNADLSKAFFYEMQKVENVENADFKDANLEGTQFHDVDLSAAKNLTQDQINQAVGKYNTKLPDGLVRPASWGEKFTGKADEK